MRVTQTLNGTLEKKEERIFFMSIKLLSHKATNNNNNNNKVHKHTESKENKVNKFSLTPISSNWYASEQQK